MSLYSKNELIKKKIRTSALIFVETLELSKAIGRVDIVATQEKRSREWKDLLNKEFWWVREGNRR